MANFQFAADTAAAWASNNRTPLLDELCVESDRLRIKLGDGSTAYNSLPGSDGHDDILRAGLGLVSWAYTPSFNVTANRTLTSQALYAVAVPYRKGDLVTNIWWNLVTAAAGTSPTAMYVGVASSAGLLLMDSTNLNANAGWTSTGFRSLPLTSALTIPSYGMYYHLLLQNGAYGTTQPQLNSTSLLGNTFGSTVLYGLGGTGKTTLGTVNSTTLTITGSGTNYPLWTASS